MSFTVSPNDGVRADGPSHQPIAILPQLGGQSVRLISGMRWFDSSREDRLRQMGNWMPMRNRLSVKSDGGNKAMVKKIITEISEEDFRKLDLKVKRNERVQVDKRTHAFRFVERSLNEILDNEIAAIVEGGYESERKWLELPVTVAIHEDNGYYLDKFMNRFTGGQTFQIGFGIGHLYSTRDYYEMRGDYWRVRKDETKVIYRIRLSARWLEGFVVKHKTVSEDWPYNELPEGVSPDYAEAQLCVDYDLIGGEFKEGGRYGRFVYGDRECHVPVDKDGHKAEPSWKNDVKSVN